MGGVGSGRHAAGAGKGSPSKPSKMQKNRTAKHVSVNYSSPEFRAARARQKKAGLI